jgi:hypothetical protein
VAAIDRYADAHDIPVVRFAKGQSKEEFARPYFARAERDGRFGVVLIGVAQEKTTAWRGHRRGGADGHPHFEFSRRAVFVNHYYFYLRDRDWGPAFIKTCAYAPFPVWVYLNGHEWAKRQAERAGVGFALDNGFRSTADAEALGAICARLSSREVWRFFDRWQARLPSPLDAADRRRGYRYALAFRQLELSDTRVFDRPQAGRAWFEQTIRDQLELGRPDHVAVIFARRINPTTPGRFQTRVINRGVEPAIQVHYKASKIKQYFKQGRALRTETTVNDTRDFGIGRLLTQDNWNALLDLGHHTNQRLLDAQLQACACAPNAATLERVVPPSHQQGQPAPGLRFGDPRAMALLASLCCFTHPFDGFTNRSLRALIAGLIPDDNARQMTHDPRRLRRKRFIVRIPGSQRYQLTAHRRRLGLLHQHAHPHRLPRPRRARPRPPRPHRPHHHTRPTLAPIRTSARHPHRRRRHHSPEHDLPVNLQTTKRS